ncbi:MAG: hypothetical protein HY671_12815 [Chloroflexi bacterium]|nr:hypothetical protein [Chloroflexota bacterium]
MNETQKTFHADEEAQTLVLSVIHEAQKHAILVTPYVDLWDTRRMLSLSL